MVGGWWRYPNVAGPNSNSVPIRAIPVTDWSSDASMTSVLAAYDATPSDYAPILHVLNLTDGTSPANIQVIHYLWYQTMNGTTAPVCVDQDGYIVTAGIHPPGFDGSHESGWVRIDLSTRKVVDGLQEASGQVGWGNRDENLSVSACSTGIVGIHTQEGNAQDSGYFHRANTTWYLTEGSVGGSQQMRNTQGGGSDQGVISGGLIYHLAHPHTLMCWKGS